MRVLNCGGKGGKPGPCPTGAGGGKIKGAYYAGRVKGEHVKSHSFTKSATGKVTGIKMHDGEGRVIAHETGKEHDILGLGKHLTQTFKSRERPTGNSSPGGSTVKKLNRAKYIAALTGNCDCWKGAEEVLNQMTDDQLRAVKGGADVEAAALVAYNAATGETQVTGRDLLAFVANAGKKPAETETEDEDEEGEVEAEDRSPGKKMAGNSANPFEGLTDEQAFDVLPSSLKKLVANAKKVEDARKTELVGKLTANCAKEKVEAAKVRFNAMDLDTLEDLAAALPVGNAKADEDDDNPFRTRPTANAGEDDEDGLFLNAARPANRLARFGPAEGDRTGTVVNAGKGVVTEDDGFDIRPLDEVIAANSVFDPTRALANGRPARK